MEVEDSSLNGFPFTHSLLRGRWYWLILVWQSVVHARWLLPEEREVANLAAILVRLKHRARRQSYNKNQYHKLSVCHHLLTTAARTLVIHYYYGAVLAPAIIITKKYYRLQFEVEFAICSSHCLHLIKTQGTFCSYKERITRFPLTWPTWKMSWCCKKALQAGSSLLRCSLLARFASHTSDLPVTTVLLSLCVGMCACMWCEDVVHP